MNKKILIIIVLMSIVVLSVCNSSYDDCKFDCMKINEGRFLECGFFLCIKTGINETISEYCFEECK